MVGHHLKKQLPPSDISFPYQFSSYAINILLSWCMIMAESCLDDYLEDNLVDDAIIDVVYWLMRREQRRDKQRRDESLLDYTSDEESNSSKMTTPSPEYPVLVLCLANISCSVSHTVMLTISLTRTKPGAQLHGKPVRTYGKRSATESRGETAAKRVKTSYETEQRLSDGNNSTTSSSIYPRSTPSTITGESYHSSDEDEEGTPGPKSKGKGCSILSYFKPVQAATPISRSDATSVRSSMPPSPCQDRSRPPKRPRRMLRLRPAVPSSPSQPEKAEEPVETPACDKENTPAPEEEEETAEPLKLSNSKPSSGVQTTINISSKASFSECKVCDTVWNPFYADDEKYHKKRHAAVLRAKKRKADALT
jgi:hypothetical protein